MSLILLTLACGEPEIEFQDLTQDETTATTDEVDGEATDDDGAPTTGGDGDAVNDEGAPTKEGGAPETTEDEIGEGETVTLGGENGVQATAGEGTGAHATIGGEKGVDLGAGGERGGAQIDVAEGAFKANAGGGEEFQVQIGRNNEVGIQGKSVKVGDKKVSWGDKKKTE